MSRENLDHVVLGVLYDFMGFLTTREEKLILSASNDAAPAVEVIKEFCDLRKIEDCEPLQQWEGRLAKTNIEYPWPDPKPEDLKSEDFNLIWECIKTWDINVPEVDKDKYSGATGNHVMSILFAAGKRNIQDYI